MRVLFMGTPVFARTVLDALVHSRHEVVCVVTQPDKRGNRGNVCPSAVKEYAENAGIPVRQYAKARIDGVDDMRAFGADIYVTAAYGQILSREILESAKYGTINVHASLLPAYRGSCPVQRAIMNGETLTGVTTFMLNSEIDKGAILGRREVEIAYDDTAGTLHDKLMEAGAGLVLETVDKIAAGSAVPVEQPVNDEGLKSAPKIFKDDCRINWNADERTVYDFVRGLSPYPAAWSPLKRNGGEELHVKIYSAQVVGGGSGEAPGTLFSDGRTFIRVACGGGMLSIRELQVAGKKRMGVEEFLRGFKEIGDCTFL